MAELFFALSLVLMMLALHPFTTYPLSLKWLRRKFHRPLNLPAEPSAPPPMAILTCAYNEEAVIRDKAENLLALRETVPELEIMIYVDAASDRTAEILREYEDRITVIVSPTREGKTYGMNLMVARTTAPIVVFTDANVTIEKEALVNLARYFEDPDVGCVCSHLIYDNDKDSVTAASGAAYWRMEEWIKQLESDTGSAMGADGSMFAIRRELHRPAPEELFDDMVVSFNVLCEGSRIVRGADVLAHETTTSSARDEFHRKIRIGCASWSAHRHLWPRIRRLDGWNLYKYVSHKLLRWLCFFSLAASGVFFLAGIAAAGAPLTALGLLLAGLTAAAAGHYLNIPPFNKAVDILLAMLATGIGVLRSMSGQNFRTWTPVASIRRQALAPAAANQNAPLSGPRGDAVITTDEASSPKERNPSRKTAGVE
ncbi:glycosyltransferase [Telmatospirillum sp. J64-1]|uniref:glycosyltransferase n=1 Tax=Telmatospirillum sp. J64-1 TaxID=2502183 RepID=UPI00163DB90E|nr:glycosyltransferase [Telmatospirillum sp. J64-1]